jgi:hypothetical protein
MRVGEQARDPPLRSAMPQGSTGKDSITSHSRIRNASSQPPRNPASNPNATPTSTDRMTDASPTASDMRVPYIKADRMSRPWSSVPRKILGASAGAPRRGQACVTELQGSQVEGVVGSNPRSKHRAENADEGNQPRTDGRRRSTKAVTDIAVKPSGKGIGHGVTVWRPLPATVTARVVSGESSQQRPQRGRP